MGDSGSCARDYRPAYASRVHGHGPAARAQRSRRGGCYLCRLVQSHLRATRMVKGIMARNGEIENAAAGVKARKRGGVMYAPPARPSQVASPGSSSDCPKPAGGQVPGECFGGTCTAVSLSNLGFSCTRRLGEIYGATLVSSRIWRSFRSCISGRVWRCFSRELQRS